MLDIDGFDPGCDARYSVNFYICIHCFQNAEFDLTQTCYNSVDAVEIFVFMNRGFFQITYIKLWVGSIGNF